VCRQKPISKPRKKMRNPSERRYRASKIWSYARPPQPQQTDAGGSRKDQNPRFLARRLRRLPFGLLDPPRGARDLAPGPPPPKFGERRCRSSARLTRRFLPRNWWPSNRCTASAAIPSSANSTKANPLGRPETWSKGTDTSVTWPTSEKSFSRSSCVVS
jgi:hypothetical protein